MNEDAKDNSGAFAALSDPTRRAILRILRKGSRTAGELAAEFSLSKPTLSHHFAVLRDAGLVRSERQGTSVVYALSANAFEEILAEILELSAPKKARRET